VPIAHPGECGAVCGGLGPFPPCGSDEFCKFPPGTCGDPTVLGECRPIPGACPDVWDPVCGCDGRTYGNECEADAAGVSIAHRGVCDVTDCAATRVLGSGDGAYCPGFPTPVRILLTPPAGVTVVALEDTPPPGWAVSNISDGGVFDAVNGKVKWGPFFAPGVPAAVAYEVTPPTGTDGLACFAGVISLDGFNRVVCGDECIVRSCCPRLAADLPQPPCPNCPVVGCNNNLASCADGRVTLGELIGYACAWLTGCNDDLSGMTRAAYVWRNGECYCWDEGAQNWYPTFCPAPDTGCCPSFGRGDVSGAGSAVASIASDKLKGGTRTLDDGRLDRGRQLRVSVSIDPAAGTTAVALEMSVPPRWTVVSASDGGVWDDLHRKVKWGPLYGDGARTLTFDVTGFTAQAAAPIDRVSSPRLPKGFAGTVSFDGVNHAITVP